VAFFSFISEFRNPAEYPKALFLLQGVDTFMYLLVAAVVYAFAGENVASPALSSTDPLLKKAAYGVAIPTIVIAGVINGHVACKYIYVRMFRGTDMMSKNNLKSFGSWALIAFVLWTTAWIIAEAIPVFNDLLGLVSSLFASWFTYGLSGFFWLHMNKGRYTESKKKMALTAVNGFLILLAFFIVSSIILHNLVFQFANVDRWLLACIRPSSQSKVTWHPERPWGHLVAPTIRLRADKHAHSNMPCNLGRGRPVR
jgi:Transmembrane amino acid transporter protein